MAATNLIGLVGRKRVGKDTVAAYLGSGYGYQRYAFADALREAALALDPIVGLSDEYEDVGMYTYPSLRLSEIVAIDGWELAKAHPEVRRTLQRYGVAIREMDEDFWVRAVLAQLDRDAVPAAVITDVRFPNEARHVQVRGGRLVRIIRPGLDESDTHISETALNDYPVDVEIVNDGSLHSLYLKVDALID